MVGSGGSGGSWPASPSPVNRITDASENIAFPRTTYVVGKYEISYVTLIYLPPAYVVRREGNVLTRVCPSICLSTGGWWYPYPIMLCNITQNAMGQTLGGVPISHNALQHFPECHGADT